MDGRRLFKPTGVSLSPDHRRAVSWLAKQDGHSVISRVIQDLIHREMVERLGADWSAVLREAGDEAEVARVA